MLNNFQEFLNVQKYDVNNYVVTGGADSKEGVWSTVNFFDGTKVKKTVNLSSFFIYDLIQMSDKSFIACGTSVKVNDKFNRIDRSGVIFETSDLQNWKLIFKTKSNCSRGCRFTKSWGFNDSVAFVGSDGLLVTIKSTKGIVAIKE